MLSTRKIVALIAVLRMVFADQSLESHPNTPQRCPSGQTWNGHLCTRPCLASQECREWMIWVIEGDLLTSILIISCATNFCLPQGLFFNETQELFLLTNLIQKMTISISNNQLCWRVGSPGWLEVLWGARPKQQASRVSTDTSEWVLPYKIVTQDSYMLKK